MAAYDPGTGPRDGHRILWLGLIDFGCSDTQVRPLNFNPNPLETLDHPAQYLDYAFLPLKSNSRLFVNGLGKIQIDLFQIFELDVWQQFRLGVIDCCKA